MGLRTTTPMPLVVYSWRRKDPRTGRWRLLRWKMNDGDAQAWAKMEGAELERVEGSAEERTPTTGAMPSGTMPAAPGVLERLNAREPGSEGE